MSWDGTERRKTDCLDHDLLIRIDTNLTNFMDKFIAHVLEDKTAFINQDNRIKNIERVVWAAAGLLFAVELILRFIK